LRYNTSHENFYYLLGPVPLRTTTGEGNISKPIASIQILEATHFMQDGNPMTKGCYKVVEAFEDNEIHFDGFEIID